MTYPSHLPAIQTFGQPGERGYGSFRGSEIFSGGPRPPFQPFPQAIPGGPQPLRRTFMTDERNLPDLNIQPAPWSTNLQPPSMAPGPMAPAPMMSPQPPAPPQPGAQPDQGFDLAAFLKQRREQQIQQQTEAYRQQLVDNNKFVKFEDIPQIPGMMVDRIAGLPGRLADSFSAIPGQLSTAGSTAAQSIKKLIGLLG